MNISRLPHVPLQTAAASAPRQGNSPGAAPTLPAPSAPADSDGLQVDTTSKHSARVANLSAKIDARVQNAVDGSKLSDDQKKELATAAAKFQQLMNRIGNADFTDAPKRQVLYALHQLGHEVQQALQVDEEGTGAVSAFAPPAATAAPAPANVLASKIDKLA